MSGHVRDGTSPFAFSFSLEYHPYIKHWCHENKGNDHNVKIDALDF